MKTVLLLGDSIRLGYQAEVAQALAGRATVVGPQDNCWTSTHLLARLDEWVAAQPVDVVHLNCGLHDLAWERDTQAVRTALPQYTDNLRAMVQRLRATTRATILWASITPVNEAWHHANKPFDRHEANVRAYNAAAASVMAAAGVPTDDLYATITAAGRDTVMCPDGVHYLPAGCALLGRTVAAFLLPYL